MKCSFELDEISNVDVNDVDEISNDKNDDDDGDDDSIPDNDEDEDEDDDSIPDNDDADDVDKVDSIDDNCGDLFEEVELGRMGAAVQPVSGQRAVPVKGLIWLQSIWTLEERHTELTSWQRERQTGKGSGGEVALTQGWKKVGHTSVE